MSKRRRAVLLLAATLAISACGSSGDADTDGADTNAASATVDGDLVAVGAAPLPGDGVGSLGDAVEVAAGAPGQADDAACAVDRQTLELAVETYSILNGAPPANQQELVDTQMIRELSERFDVTAEGVVVPAPGSPCS